MLVIRSYSEPPRRQAISDGVGDLANIIQLIELNFWFVQY